SRAVAVWVPICAQENVITGTGARDDVDELHAEQSRNLRGQPKLLVGHAAERDDRDFPTVKLPQLQGGLGNRGLPVNRGQFLSGRDPRLEQSFFRFEITKIEPAVIAHPTRVDRIVLARRLAVDDILARADERVATGRATGADTFCFLQKPDAHLESEVR